MAEKCSNHIYSKNNNIGNNIYEGNDISYATTSKVYVLFFDDDAIEYINGNGVLPKIKTRGKSAKNETL